MEELLKDYKRAVEEYAKNRTDYVFQNQGDAHARIVLSSMFLNSKDYIRIAANSLTNMEVVGTTEYVQPLLAFVNKPTTKLDIIVSEYDSNIDNPLFKQLKETDAYAQKRVRIRNANGGCFRDEKKNVIHFTVADTCMYRYETDVEQRSATCNMGGKNFAKSLEDAFDKAFDTLNEVI